MRKTLALTIAGVSLLALAACGDGGNTQQSGETPPASTAQPAPAPAEPATTTTTTTTTTPAPAATDATALVDEAMKQLKEQAATMTPEQKAQAVTMARTQAESMAKQMGQSDDMAKQMGDQAEAMAKQALGVQ